MKEDKAIVCYISRDAVYTCESVGAHHETVVSTASDAMPFTVKMTTAGEMLLGGRGGGTLDLADNMYVDEYHLLVDLETANIQTVVINDVLDLLFRQIREKHGAGSLLLVCSFSFSRIVREKLISSARKYFAKVTCENPATAMGMAYQVYLYRQGTLWEIRHHPFVSVVADADSIDVVVFSYWDDKPFFRMKSFRGIVSEVRKAVQEAVMGGYNLLESRHHFSGYFQNRKTDHHAERVMTLSGRGSKYTFGRAPDYYTIDWRKLQEIAREHVVRPVYLSLCSLFDLYELEDEQGDAAVDTIILSGGDFGKYPILVDSFRRIFERLDGAEPYVWPETAIMTEWAAEYSWVKQHSDIFSEL